MVKTIIAIALFCSTFTARATVGYIDEDVHDTLTIRSMSRFEQTLDKITSSQAYQMTCIGVPLIIGGAIVKGEDDHFQQLRNDYLPSFNRHFDDYLQYLPAAVMLGMKVGGVEGRSSWGRMLVSDAFSAIIMSTVVWQLKVSTQVTRPDGSNNHSFPSGHTATAFMTATMMSKEYGGRCPWYSVGAYSVATVTGLMRMANNKHWLSDVLAGAGFGILSTELGYYLADLIFKDKGFHSFHSQESFDRLRFPSFIGIYMGFNLAPGTYLLPDHYRLKFSTGSNAGIEGAWFFSPYIGIGGRFSAGNMAVTLNNEGQNNALDLISGYAGTYFSYPLSSRLQIGSKLLVGYNYFTSCKLPTMTIGNKGGIGMGTGLSFSFQAKQNMAAKLFFDYNLIHPAIQSEKKCMQLMTLGSSVAVSF